MYGVHIWYIPSLGHALLDDLNADDLVTLTLWPHHTGWPRNTTILGQNCSVLFYDWKSCFVFYFFMKDDNVVRRKKNRLDWLTGNRLLVPSCLGKFLQESIFFCQIVGNDWIQLTKLISMLFLSWIVSLLDRLEIPKRLLPKLWWLRSWSKYQ